VLFSARELAHDHDQDAVREHDRQRGDQSEDVRQRVFPRFETELLGLGWIRDGFAGVSGDLARDFNFVVG